MKALPIIIYLVIGVANTIWIVIKNKDKPSKDLIIETKYRIAGVWLVLTIWLIYVYT